MWDGFTAGMVIGLALSCSAVAGIGLAPALAEAVGTLAYWVESACGAVRRWLARRFTGR